MATSEITRVVPMKGPVGIVIIGRNEGERLHHCLAAVVNLGLPVVYVDSSSTDGSVAMAREMGADVVELDMTRPFTAGRARNAGFARLEEIDAGIEHVQFVDGDCELNEQWPQQAMAYLNVHAEVAAVCGRLLRGR